MTLLYTKTIDITRKEEAVAEAANIWQQKNENTLLVIDVKDKKIKK